MAKKKEKVSFFEGVEFENSGVANEYLAKENKAFMFKLICTVLAGIGNAFFVLSFEVASGGVLETMCYGIYFVGLVATLATGPINVLKTFFKFGKFVYWIVPFLLIDLLGFVFGLCFGLIAFIYFPVIYASLNLLQSYRNKKATEKYLALNR